MPPQVGVTWTHCPLLMKAFSSKALFFARRLILLLVLSWLSGDSPAYERCCDSDTRRRSTSKMPATATATKTSAAWKTAGSTQTCVDGTS